MLLLLLFLLLDSKEVSVDGFRVKCAYDAVRMYDRLTLPICLSLCVYTFEV